jgi:phosphoglycerate kinase
MAKALLGNCDPAGLNGRRVVVRCDLNVPLDSDGRVSDDTRIRRSLPTLERLARDGARTVVLSHLGRPGGQPVPECSLEPAALRLAELADVAVHFCPNLVNEAAATAVAALAPGEVLVLENTRFEPGETRNDEALAERLADYGDLFVQDAFGAAHRAHASNEGVARVIRSRGGQAVAGLLLEQELHHLQGLLDDPARPFTAVIGGAKISGKIDVIESLLPRVDHLLIGGAMANTFFKALGFEVGDSLVEDDRLDVARDVLERAGERLLLPIDARVTEQIAPGATGRVVARDAVGSGDRIADIGPETVKLYRGVLLDSRTILWNGPMGVFEIEEFAAGTFGVAEAVAEAADAGAATVVGGGDSVAAVEQAGIAERIGHISTGGGASLELLSGATLPGVDILSEAEELA